MTITDEKQAEVEEPKPSWEFRRFTPKGFDGPPETPVEALLQAQTVLFDEERWVKQEWYQNKHPKIDPDDPFCNDWKVCAAGAVFMVTIGATRQLTKLDFAYNDDYSKYEVLACPIPKDQQQWGVDWAGSEQDNPEAAELYNKALAFLRDGGNGVVDGFVFDNVPAFNDHYRTTRQDVLKAFSKGIALAARAEVEAEVNASVAERLNNVFAKAKELADA